MASVAGGGGGGGIGGRDDGVEILKFVGSVMVGNCVPSTVDVSPLLFSCTELAINVPPRPFFEEKVSESPESRRFLRGDLGKSKTGALVPVRCSN